MPRRIEGKEALAIRHFFEAAAGEAKKATCLRARCGSVVVSKSGVILGRGYNAPPLGDESQRRCEAELDFTKKPKYDKTCCVHAEWNAVIDALANSQKREIDGSRLYFMRVDEHGNFTDAGEPYCTTCSRFTMQAGVSEFALWNDDGADVYTLPEYNQVSYEYHLMSKSLGEKI